MPFDKFNLLRDSIAALRGARNRHVLLVHSGFSTPCASHSSRSLRFTMRLLQSESPAMPGFSFSG